MRKLVLSTVLSVASLSAWASCEEVAARIDAKLQAKGVKSYTLSIVPVGKANAPAPASAPAAATASAPVATSAPAAAAPQGKIVGTCDSGTKQIIYIRH